MQTIWPYSFPDCCGRQSVSKDWDCGKTWCAASGSTAQSRLPTSRRHAGYCQHLRDSGEVTLMRDVKLSTCDHPISRQRRSRLPFTFGCTGGVTRTYDSFITLCWDKCCLFKIIKYIFYDIGEHITYSPMFIICMLCSKFLFCCDAYGLLNLTLTPSQLSF